MATQRRHPDDGPPRTPARTTAEERGAVRFELPVRFGSVPGLVVIRVFADRDEPEMSIRGYAAEWLITQGRSR